MTQASFSLSLVIPEATLTSKVNSQNVNPLLRYRIIRPTANIGSLSPAIYSGPIGVFYSKFKKHTHLVLPSPARAAFFLFRPRFFLTHGPFGIFVQISPTNLGLYGNPAPINQHPSDFFCRTCMSLQKKKHQQEH